MNNSTKLNDIRDLILFSQEEAMKKYSRISQKPSSELFTSMELKGSGGDYSLYVFCTSMPASWYPSIVLNDEIMSRSIGLTKSEAIDFVSYYVDSNELIGRENGPRTDRLSSLDYSSISYPLGLIPSSLDNKIINNLRTTYVQARNAIGHNKTGNTKD
jgi:hypothetical protein